MLYFFKFLFSMYWHYKKTVTINILSFSTAVAMHHIFLSFSRAVAMHHIFLSFSTAVAMHRIFLSLSIAVAMHRIFLSFSSGVAMHRIFLSFSTAVAMHRIFLSFSTAVAMHRIFLSFSTAVAMHHIFPSFSTAVAMHHIFLSFSTAVAMHRAFFSVALEKYFLLGSVIVEAPQSHTHIRASNRTPLNEWSANRRGRTYTTHNKHKRRTTMLSAGFEAAIPAIKRIQICALDRTVTGTHTPYRYNSVALFSKISRLQCCFD